VAAEDTEENSHALEAYVEVALTELGPAPKIGIKWQRARKVRLERVMDSAAQQAGFGRDQLEERLTRDDDEKLRDVFALAASRATQVDDEEYLDVLGRLIAGALDSAAVDEYALVTAELVQLEPAHLRALLGFFHFGREGDEKADPDLSPSDASWATNRYRTDREIAGLLHLGREATGQVLLRLDRGGFVRHSGGPVQGGETTSGPTDWAGRVVSLLFPPIYVEFRNTIEKVDPDKASETVRNSVTPRDTQDSMRELEKETRAISELEKEIKAIERAQSGPAAGVMTVLGDQAWLAKLKRRLQQIDPTNPWAFD
jgi:hypothetical protein